MLISPTLLLLIMRISRKVTVLIPPLGRRGLV